MQSKLRSISIYAAGDVLGRLVRLVVLRVGVGFVLVALSDWRFVVFAGTGSPDTDFATAMLAATGFAEVGFDGVGFVGGVGFVDGVGLVAVEGFVGVGVVGVGFVCVEGFVGVGFVGVVFVEIGFADCASAMF